MLIFVMHKDELPHFQIEIITQLLPNTHTHTHTQCVETAIKRQLSTEEITTVRSS